MEQVLVLGECVCVCVGGGTFTAVFPGLVLIARAEPRVVSPVVGEMVSGHLF